MPKVQRKFRAVVLTGAVGLVPLLSNCGQMPKGGVPGGGGSCPSDPAAIMNASFGLDAKVEGKLKAALSASAHLQSIAARVEGDVTAACSGLAKDLGATDEELAPKEKGPGKKAEAACNVAAKLVGDFKAKAEGELSVDVKPPKCTASMDAYAECAGSCDASVEPGSVEVECEGGEISGTCEGKCEGTCNLEAGAQCEGTCTGTCSGSCEAGFSGKCGGECDGKCDGEDTTGKCEGTCEGKCSAEAEGSCSGSCNGSCSASCQVEASGECSGSCSGSCDVEMKAPRCEGEVKPPEMSAECEANCDAEVSAEMECTPAVVDVSMSGSADADAALKLRTALRANLPALLKVSMGMKGAVEDAAAGVKTTVEGVKATVTSDSKAALKAGACIAAALKAQAEASVSISVSVKASASASGSANAG